MTGVHYPRCAPVILFTTREEGDIVSEGQERLGYVSGRVLIESDRVLNPDFPALWMYLTSAQVELLRNVVSYLQELSTFVKTYESEYYLTPGNVDFGDILAIVADVEEKLMGSENTVLGYDDRIFEKVDFTVTSAGTNILQMVPVTSGFVYFLQAVTTRNDSKVTTQTKSLATGDDQLVIDRVANAAQNIWHTITVSNILLRQGDAFEGTFLGCDIGDVLHMKIWGYKMIVPA